MKEKEKLPTGNVLLLGSGECSPSKFLGESLETCSRISFCLGMKEERKELKKKRELYLDFHRGTYIVIPQLVRELN